MTEASPSTSNREAQFLEWPAQAAPAEVFLQPPLHRLAQEKSTQVLSRLSAYFVWLPDLDSNQ